MEDGGWWARTVDDKEELQAGMVDWKNIEGMAARTLVLWFYSSKWYLGYLCDFCILNGRKVCAVMFSLRIRFYSRKGVEGRIISDTMPLSPSF